MPVAELGEGLLVRLLSALQTRLGSVIGAGILVAESPGNLRPVASVGVAEVWDAMQIDSGSGPLVQAVKAEKAAGRLRVLAAHFEPVRGAKAAGARALERHAEALGLEVDG